MTNSANLGSATLDLKASLTNLDKNLATAEGKSKKSVGKMNKLLGGLALGAAGGGLAIAGIGAAALGSAKDFDKGIREVNTLIGGDAQFLKQLKSDALAFSEEMGISTDKVVPAMYQAISSGVPSDNVFEFMKTAGQAAIGGSAELTDVIAVGTSIAKGYGKEMGDVGDILDQLQNVVKLGVTTMPELAVSMGKVVPMASALGVTLPEVNGAMATLTGVTGNTAEVSTQLRATYQAMLKPTSEMGWAIAQVAEDMEKAGVVTKDSNEELFNTIQQYRWAEERSEGYKRGMEKVAEAGLEGEDAFRLLNREMGFSEESADAALERHGNVDDALVGLSKSAERAGKDMQGFKADMVELSATFVPTLLEAEGFQSGLGRIASKADGNSAVLGKMLGSVEAINAVLALTGPQSDNFTEKLEAMGASTGSVNAAFTEMEGSLERQQETFKNQLSVVMTQLGEKILPIVSNFLSEHLIPGFRSLTEWYDKNSDQINQIAGGIWNGLMAAIAPVKEVLTAFIIPLFQNLSDIWQNTIIPAVSEIKTLFLFHLMPAIREIGGAFSGVFGADGEGSATSGLETAKNVATALANIWSGTLKVAINVLIAAIKVAIAVIKPFLEMFAGLLKNDVMPALQRLTKLWREKLQPAFSKLFGKGGAGPSGAETFATISRIARVLATILKFQLKVAINIIVFAITALVETITFLIDLPDKIKNAWRSLKNFFKDTFSFIGELIKGVINTYIELFNIVIRGLNNVSVKVPSWVPGIGGKGFDVNIPEIPALAQGGVVNQPTIAQLGEEGSEVVIPLKKFMPLSEAMKIHDKLLGIYQDEKQNSFANRRFYSDRQGYDVNRPDSGVNVITIKEVVQPSPEKTTVRPEDSFPDLNAFLEEVKIVESFPDLNKVMEDIAVTDSFPDLNALMEDVKIADTFPDLNELMADLEADDDSNWRRIASDFKDTSYAFVDTVDSIVAIMPDMLKTITEGTILPSVTDITTSNLTSLSDIVETGLAGVLLPETEHSAPTINVHGDVYGLDDFENRVMSIYNSNRRQGINLNQ